MAELFMIMLVAPAVGGALIHHLWTTRPARQRHSGMAVGQIPQRMRRRSRMAVRRAGGAA